MDIERMRRAAQGQAAGKKKNTGLGMALRIGAAATNEIMAARGRAAQEASRDKDRLADAETRRQERAEARADRDRDRVVEDQRYEQKIVRDTEIEEARWREKQRRDDEHRAQSRTDTEEKRKADLEYRREKDKLDREAKAAKDKAEEADDPVKRLKRVEAQRQLDADEALENQLHEDEPELQRIRDPQAYKRRMDLEEEERKEVRAGTVYDKRKADEAAKNEREKKEEAERNAREQGEEVTREERKETLHRARFDRERPLKNADEVVREDRRRAEWDRQFGKKAERDDTVHARKRDDEAERNEREHLEEIDKEERHRKEWDRQRILKGDDKNAEEDARRAEWDRQFGVREKGEEKRDNRELIQELDRENRRRLEEDRQKAGKTVEQLAKERRERAEWDRQYAKKKADADEKGLHEEEQRTTRREESQKYWIKRYDIRRADKEEDDRQKRTDALRKDNEAKAKAGDKEAADRLKSFEAGLKSVEKLEHQAKVEALRQASKDAAGDLPYQEELYGKYLSQYRKQLGVSEAWDDFHVRASRLTGTKPPAKPVVPMEPAVEEDDSSYWERARRTVEGKPGAGGGGTPGGQGGEGVLAEMQGPPVPQRPQGVLELLGGTPGGQGGGADDDPLGDPNAQPGDVYQSEKLDAEMDMLGSGSQGLGVLQEMNRNSAPQIESMKAELQAIKDPDAKMQRADAMKLEISQRGTTSPGHQAEFGPDEANQYLRAIDEVLANDPVLVRLQRDRGYESGKRGVLGAAAVLGGISGAARTMPWLEFPGTNAPKIASAIGLAGDVALEAGAPGASGPTGQFAPAGGVADQLMDVVAPATRGGSTVLDALQHPSVLDDPSMARRVEDAVDSVLPDYVQSGGSHPNAGGSSYGAYQKMFGDDEKIVGDIVAEARKTAPKSGSVTLNSGFDPVAAVEKVIDFFKTRVTPEDINAARLLGWYGDPKSFQPEKHWVLGGFDMNDAQDVLPESTSVLRPAHAHYERAVGDTNKRLNATWGEIKPGSVSDRKIAYWLDGDKTINLTPAEQAAADVMRTEYEAKFAALKAEGIVTDDQYRDNYITYLRKNGHKVLDPNEYAAKEIRARYLLPRTNEETPADLSAIESFSAYNRLIEKKLNLDPAIEVVRDNIMPKLMPGQKQYLEAHLKAIVGTPTKLEEAVQMTWTGMKDWSKEVLSPSGSNNPAKIAAAHAIDALPEQAARMAIGLKVAISRSIIGLNQGSAVMNGLYGAINVSTGPDVMKAIQKYYQEGPKATTDILRSMRIASYEPPTKLGKQSVYRNVMDTADKILFKTMDLTNNVTMGVGYWQGQMDGMRAGAAKGLSGQGLDDFARGAGIRRALEVQNVGGVVERAPIFSDKTLGLAFQFVRPGVKQANFVLRKLLYEQGLQNKNPLPLMKYIMATGAIVAAGKKIFGVDLEDRLLNDFDPRNGFGLIKSGRHGSAPVTQFFQAATGDLDPSDAIGMLIPGATAARRASKAATAEAPKGMPGPGVLERLQKGVFGFPSSREAAIKEYRRAQNMPEKIKGDTGTAGLSQAQITERRLKLEKLRKEKAKAVMEATEALKEFK